MKTTSVTRKMNALGRVSIPVAARRSLGIEEGSPVEILAGEDCVAVRLYRPECVFCGRTEQVRPMGENRRPVCRQCCCDAAAQVGQAQRNAG